MLSSRHDADATSSQLLTSPLFERLSVKWTDEAEKKKKMKQYSFYPLARKKLT